MRLNKKRKFIGCLSTVLTLILASSSSVSAGTVYELYELVEGSASENGYLPTYDPVSMFDLEEETGNDTSTDPADAITDGEARASVDGQTATDVFSDDVKNKEENPFQDGASGQTDASNDVQLFSDALPTEEPSLFSDQASEAETSEMFYYASSYRLSDEGVVTPVKNQASLNVCWAFSALESIETGMLKRGLVSSGIDLSETHLTYSTFHGKNSDATDGTKDETFVPISIGGDVTRWTQGSGNRFNAIATLARGYGVANSSDYPLSLLFDSDVVDGAGSTSSILDGLVNKNVQEARLKNCYWLPEVNYQSTLNGPVEFRADKIKIIKYFIKNYGGVEVGIKANGTPNPYDASTNSIYNSQPITPDHSVILVGWDDNKVTSAEKPGAFLMQNSWGTSSGENGYFWVSYYDRSLKQPSFYEMENKPLGQSENVIISQYDGTGYASVIKPATPSDNLRISGANVFTSSTNQYLTQVSFYAAAFPLPYEISVYRYVKTSPDTGELVHTQKGNLSYSGYFTVDLTEAIPIAKGEKFAIEVKFDNKNGYVPHEKVSSNTASRIYTADYGQSYLYDGKNWSDMMDIGYNCNICIKGIGVETNEEISVSPSKPGISSVNVSNGNRATAYVNSGNEKVDGYDWVIGTSANFLSTKKYTQVKKNITQDSVSFSYIPKGTYYLAVHSYRLDSEGVKNFSPWSDVYTLKIQGVTPGKTKIKSCSTGDGTLKLTYSKVSNAYKYEYVLTTKSFSSTTFNPAQRVKTYTNRSYENISLKNIPKGNYYFGIRAYTVLNGKTKVYGKWTVTKLTIK